MGLRELVLIALVALALYGRSGVVKSRQVQTLLPWLSPRRRARRPAEQARTSPTGASKKSPIAARLVLRGNRLFWFLTILAATAVAASIIARAMIVGAAKTTLP
jgi:hypothetical protein